ncbi:hypothetical protein [uncultured Croceitalea sp.]|uniref:hypothetical protein n=1 Tax=uncultured Croceitalea sp. TaxID=1798908 RepID=UPI0033057E33
MLRLMSVFYSLCLALLTLSCNDTEINLETDLAEQYNRLVLISESELCTDSGDWRFIGVGAKPCGGPSSFMAYSMKIDTLEFLRLVEQYNEDTRELNKRKGLISDCAVIPAPNIIRCENGKAILVY